MMHHRHTVMLSTSKQSKRYAIPMLCVRFVYVFSSELSHSTIMLRYGISLVYPGQPLLRLKQSHNPHNLLGAEGMCCMFGALFYSFPHVQHKHIPKSAGDSSDGRVIKEQAHVRMPPEILVSIDFQVDVLRSCYLLPSVMYRLESLMLASQLREEINGQTNNFKISSSLVSSTIFNVDVIHSSSNFL